MIGFIAWAVRNSVILVDFTGASVILTDPIFEGFWQN